MSGIDSYGDWARKHPQVVKTDHEVELMAKAGKICAEAFKTVLQKVNPGITCKELDEIARHEILKRKALSSFMTVDEYKWTICTTVNDEVVHGIPTKRVLEEGDILGIDMGACFGGYHSDMALTVPVGKIPNSTKIFLKKGQSVLKEAITQAKVGSTIGNISSTIQKLIEKSGYSVVKSLTGHGIGRLLHEDPMIPGFGKQNTGPKILENMVLAVEVIYTQGSGEVKLDPNGWTIRSKDNTLGGLFEQTIVVKKNGPIVLTPYL
ncbi:type I methionyl aminopeptidase [Candidatus Curtissbacteria bacterium RIFCSPHIGHO2_12_FULL_38_9b]|uniref:Methionine aminopeptidase n=2 Tax=Candidatus Curtissiibacteriota TaxID=1752717 RepID=A0A1F5GXD7_9BACT|nr:MAG: type I methionyl aminopeptidase [Candidatus Curtissbacteria bacterium RIFCSPLOWO2_01_FULL_37_9]OGD96546.1 MAG: type I methionyl aminopeptidase [Candidatus Curtissbacteria bacterium RIFCSPHIGHO2_12_FULL_38_9b]